MEKGKQGQETRPAARGADGRTKKAACKDGLGRQERSGLGCEQTRASEACSNAGSERSTHAGQGIARCSVRWCFWSGLGRPSQLRRAARWAWQGRARVGGSGAIHRFEQNPSPMCRARFPVAESAIRILRLILKGSVTLWGIGTGFALSVGSELHGSQFTHMHVRKATRS
jgi:hypothetical protein